MEIVLERKKELKEEYKNLKPDIGIIAIKSKIDVYKRQVLACIAGIISKSIKFSRSSP